MRTQILGVIRHILTFAGGFLVTRGVLDESVMLEVIGGIITVLGGVWSVIDKKQEN
jgi:hypothetical protein